MTLIVAVVGTALYLYSLLILGRLILSWVPLRPGTLSYRIYEMLYDVTEPYLRIFRRFVPTVRFGNAALDLSPVVGLVVLFIAQRLVVLL